MSDSLAKLRNTVATAGEPAPKQRTLRDLIFERATDIARALPAATGLTPERLTMVTYALCRTNPKLAACTPASLAGALMTAAQLGLEPGPQQHCYFIPRWNSRVKSDEVNFQIGYKGMIELARRAGVQIKTRTVYEHDDFEFSYGFEDTIVHKPALRDRGEVLGYYLTATWDGGAYVAFMNIDDIERIRERSQAKDSGPWRTDYDAMARKTVVRAAFNSNQIPQSLQIAQAINADEQVRTTIDVDAIDITREPDGTDLATDSRALDSGTAAGGDGAPDGDDAHEGGEGRQEHGVAPETDASGSSSPVVDDGVVLTEVPEGLPDDVDAAVSWLKSLSRRELVEQARKHKSVAPKNLDDTDALLELAARVIETKP